MFDKEVPTELSMSDAVYCSKLVGNLIAAAKRAKVDYEKFIERILLLPTDADYSEQSIMDDSRHQEMMEAALVVDKLKHHMTDDELTICNGIMADKSYEQIGSEMGRSKGWVSLQLSQLKERILSMMEEGSL